MEFRVFRTSDPYSEHSPCLPSASRISVESIKYEGCKKITTEVTQWFVEIPDMETLYTFFENYGELIITKDERGPVIEILDAPRY